MISLFFWNQPVISGLLSRLLLMRLINSFQVINPVQSSCDLLQIVVEF